MVSSTTCQANSVPSIIHTPGDLNNDISYYLGFSIAAPTKQTYSSAEKEKDSLSFVFSIDLLLVSSCQRMKTLLFSMLPTWYDQLSTPPSRATLPLSSTFFCILFVFAFTIYSWQLTNYTITRVHYTTIHCTRLQKYV